MKTLQIELPESVVGAIRLPEAEQPGRLRLELALGLYSQDLISLGKAAELADCDRFQLSSELARRKINRHYTEEELAEDLRYARGQ
jgi:predicted HTH domain antitoxin